MSSEVLEMFDHNLGLLRNVHWMQLQETSQGACRLLALHVRVVFPRFEQLEIGGVGRVAPQHIQNESLVGRLPHRVTVCRFSVTTKKYECLVLWRCCEGKEA